MAHNIYHRRRRNSKNSRRALSRLWKRAISRVPLGAFAVAGYVTLVLVALIFALRGDHRNVLPGLVGCSLGLAGLLRQAWLWRHRVIDAARRGEDARLRVERQSARRRREAEKQEERRKRLVTATLARDRATEIREARRTVETETAAEERRRRDEREEAIACEATRLLSLGESDLLRAATEAFARRGYRVDPVPEEAECDLVLRGTDGEIRGVARRMPGGRRAEAIDVQALDRWREEAGAATAYLIGLAGFSAVAVRLTTHLPVTLVEAYLLAQWRLANPRGGDTRAEQRLGRSGTGGGP